MKKLNKLLAVITALAIALSMMSLVTIADEYEYTVYINSVDEFLALATAEDADNDGQIYKGYLIVLNIDIDFSEFTSVQESYASNLFPLFSGTGAGFAGTFDGNGHIISNYNIDSSGSYVGLFASINGGIVKNLTITGSVSGGSNVGAIAGTVTDGTISNCTSYVTVSSIYEEAWSYDIGGIVGYAKESTITNCKNYGSSVDGDNDVGGIAGVMYDTTISNCVNYSNVTMHETWGVGGIAGEIHGDSLVSSCSNYGDVVSVDDGGMVGGIAGSFNSGDGEGTVDNCYNCGAISGPTSVGGIVGKMTNAYQITNCTNDGDVVGTGNRVGGVIGYALNLYSIENCHNNGDVTSSGYYVGGIAGRTSLDDFNSCSVSFDYIIVSDCSNTGDICGGYNYISGIFGDAKAVIVTDCYNTGSISTTSDRGASMGGITGYLYDDSSLTDCYNEGTVTGYQLIGGVVGNSAGGNIERCYNTGSVTGAVGYIGGVVARATSETGYGDVTCILKDSYNTGSVTSTGTSAYIGGIAGVLNCVYCENCYNAGSVIADDSGHIGAAFGSANLNNSGEMLGTVSNVYYLDTSAESAVGSLSTNSFTSYVTAGLTSKTEEEFNSGEVTYLLNGSTCSGDLIWHQTVVDSSTDQYPVLNDKSKTVLQITVILDDDIYGVCYTNVDCILEEYPTSNLGDLLFYYDKELTSEIETATGIYSNDTIIYAAYAQEDVEYSISVSKAENGTVTASPETAAAGDTVALTITPAEGYEVSSVTVTYGSGTEVTVAADYTFTMPENDVTVTVVFAEKSGGSLTDDPSTTTTHTATTTQTSLGTVTVTPTSAEAGATVTVTVTANTGYTVAGITVKDASGSSVTVSGSNGVYTFTMPSSAATITPLFTADSSSSTTEHTHTYVFVGWTWSSDLNSAIGTFYCSTCGNKAIYPATVTSSTTYGVVTKNAAIYLNGVWYTDSKIDTSSTSSTSTSTTNTTTTTTTETVDEVIQVEDPIESTETDTEPDDSEPEEVTEPEAESNPTTGIAISLIPMAIAALAAVSSKRR